MKPYLNRAIWGAAVCGLTGLLLSGCIVIKTHSPSRDTNEDSTAQTSIAVYEGGAGGAGGAVTTITNGVRHVFHNGAGSHQRTLSATTPVRGILAVNVTTDFGEIVVESSPGDKTFTVNAVITLSDTVKNPEATLKGFSVKCDIASGVLTPRVIAPAGVPDSATYTVSYKITVPEAVEADFDLRSENGTVAVRLGEANGKIAARSTFGGVTVEKSDGTGDIVAESENGEVEVKNDSRDAASVTAKSEFGQVSVRAPFADDISAHSENGAVLVKGATSADEIVGTSEFGKVSITACVGKRVRGRSENGSVTFVGTASQLTLGATFGSVDAEIENAERLTEVEAISENGAVSVTLPRTAQVAIVAETENGALRVAGDAPVPPTGGDSDDVKRYEATWNRGTAPMRIKSEFGSVTLHVR